MHFDPAPGSTTASPQLGSFCAGDFLAANSTGSNRPAEEIGLRLLFQRSFFRWRSSVLKLKPRLRQNSLRRTPLLTNSTTNCWTSARVRRLGADNSIFAVIRTLQHRPRLSNRCVGQTLTVQRSQDAFRIENSASPHASEESQSPLPVPPSLLQNTTTELPSGESKLAAEGHDLLLPLLTVLVVSLAMILGMILGMHRAHTRSEARALKQSKSVGSLRTVSAPLSGQSVTDNNRQGNPPERAEASQPIEPQDKRQEASTHSHPAGGLTVYENDRVIFRLPPSQGGMPRLVHKRPD